MNVLFGIGAIAEKTFRIFAISTKERMVSTDEGMGKIFIELWLDGFGYLTDPGACAIIYSQ